MLTLVQLQSPAGLPPKLNSFATDGPLQKAAAYRSAASTMGLS